MKSMVLLIDTNVLINILTKRDDPFKEECQKLMMLCANGAFEGYIAFHTLSILWYIIRKQFNEPKTREMVGELCNVVTVVGATQDQIKAAIKNTNFKDFEDCLQDECAQAVHADYIVTCNIKDYQHAKTKTVTPDELLYLLLQK